MTWRRITFAVALALALFQLVTGYAPLPNLIQRSIHAGLGLTLAFLLWPAGKRARGAAEHRPGALDLALAGASAVVAGYIAVQYDFVIMNVAGSTAVGQIFGWIAVLLVLEAARRAVGWVFPTLTAISLAYAFLGPYMPGRWAHPGLPPRLIVETLYYGSSGLWGSIMGISATVIALYVIFGAVLLQTGGAATFRDVSIRVAGRTPGGAAKVATVASSLFGTVSGSAISNVVTTGVFTIPMMKRLGYPAPLAAAVEATASTGGQLMPPIMGAGAFIMAELIGVPYLTIAVAAILPALLYYTSIFMGIHFEARRLGLKSVAEEAVPPWREIGGWSRLLPLVLPFVVLMTLLVRGYTVGLAGFWTVIAALALYLLIGDPKQIGQRARGSLNALVEGAKGIVTIVTLIGAAQIVVTMITLTGFAVKFSSLLMAAGENSALLALGLAMVVSMILGMGMPTSAAYLLAAAVAGPALINLGIPALAAHMFIFYFAILAVVTPPVCTAIFVAASMAETSWTRAAVVAIRLALPSFLIPFLFAFSPALLLQDSWLMVVWKGATALFGTIVLAGGVMGFIRRPATVLERVLFIVGAFLLIVPEGTTDLIGVLLITVAALLHARGGVPAQDSLAPSSRESESPSA